MSPSRGTEVSLTKEEARLEKMLLDAAKHINPQSPPELRFAGGWVRDKLLGIDSHDIDIAIDNMTGEAFGLKMKDYLETPGILEKYGMGKEIVKGLHKIAANPEKSKQLETATTKVFGLDLDLVNLRKEVYKSDSRNPVMEFGTPEEDALRRDATINSMFYNLQTRQLEDLTGQGLADMHRRIIRTPLAPYQTFKDDPLRILRLVRFASRLDYGIDSKAIEAMKDPSIKEALKAKISRERVGIEVEKMLRGKTPSTALDMIEQYDLYRTIFVDPSTTANVDPDLAAWGLVRDCLGDITSASEGAQSRLRNWLLANDEQTFLAWVLTSLIPWADAPEVDLPKKSSLPMAVLVAREGIKAPNKVCDVVATSIKNLESVRDISDQILQQRLKPSGPQLSRGKLGMAVRNWGSTWRSQVLFSLLVEVRESDRSAVIAKYEALLTTMEQLSLFDAPQMKPLVDGRNLSQALGIKPGPWMKDALDHVMEWQLDQAADATPEKAIEAIKQGELTSTLVRDFLQLTIRPLFSKPRNSHLTSMGHQKMADPHQLSRNDAWNEDGDARKPWRDSLQLLQWCVRALAQHQVPEHWPNLIPPILRLVDDEEIENKKFGLELLSDLLVRTSSDHLAYTGTGSLFEATIRPALCYLPSLTPEDEAIEILNIAFKTWSLLSRQRWLGSSPQSQEAVIRGAVVPGHSYSAYHDHVRLQMVQGHLLSSLSHLDTNYPRLSRLLLVQLEETIMTIPVLTIEDRTSIFPAVTTYLTDALLIKTCPELVVQAVRTLKTFISCSWPHLWSWRADLLKPIFLAWTNASVEVQGEPLPLLDVVRQELGDCFSTAIAAINVSVGDDAEVSLTLLRAELDEVARSEPLCIDLFSLCLSD